MTTSNSIFDPFKSCILVQWDGSINKIRHHLPVRVSERITIKMVEHGDLYIGCVDCMILLPMYDWLRWDPTDRVINIHRVSNSDVCQEYGLGGNP